MQLQLSLWDATLFTLLVAIRVLTNALELEEKALDTKGPEAIAAKAKTETENFIIGI
jgi:hypothetical protein